MNLFGEECHDDIIISFTVSYRRSRETGINIYYIPIGVKSTAQIFGFFGDQEYSGSAEFGLYTRAETLLTRN